MIYEPVGKRSQGKHPPAVFRWLHVNFLRSPGEERIDRESPIALGIRESVRMVGVIEPLLVSRRGRTRIFELQNGGTGRLAALRSLLDSTKDERYSHAPCVVVKPRSQDQQLLMRLAADQFRSSDPFWEQAQAVERARDHYMKELGCDLADDRRFWKRLRNCGCNLSLGFLSTARYAVERLGGLLPKALDAGLDREAVEAVRTLEAAAFSTWNRLCSEEGSFEPIFRELCRRLDGTEWDPWLLQKSIEHEIAEAAGTSHEFARVLLERDSSSTTENGHPAMGIERGIHHETN